MGPAVRHMNYQPHTNVLAPLAPRGAFPSSHRLARRAFSTPCFCWATTQERPWPLWGIPAMEL